MKGVILVVGFLVLEAAFLFHAALPVSAGVLLPAHRPAAARQAPAPAQAAPARSTPVTVRVG